MCVYIHLCVCIYIYMCVYILYIYIYIVCVCVCIYIYIYGKIYYKELAYAVMEVENSHDLSSANWRLRKISGIIQP